MKISIGDFDEEEVILTNESLDNFNYVSVIIGDTEVTVHVDELAHAAKAFQNININFLERDKLLK